MNKIEVALFDVDGVVIAPRKKFFSQRLIDEFGVSEENSNEFMQQLLFPSLVGKVDLRNEWPPVLKSWGIKKSVDEMLELWWSGEREIDQRVLQVVDELGEKGVKRYLATDQEKSRAQYLLDRLGLAKHFNGAFMSFQLGFQKHDPQFWQKVLEDLKTDPSKIVYWDDDQKNVDRASEAGIVAKLYSNFNQFVVEASSL